jgi:hypothetical protein
MNLWAVFLELLPQLSVSIALLVSAVSVVAEIARWRRARAERDTLIKADTKAAIDSAELSTLGFHLVERLGATSVPIYAADEKTRADFDRALSAVHSYLARDEPTDSKVENLAEPDIDVAPGPGAPPRESSADEVQRLLTEGTWTSLARSRRDLERALARLLDVTNDERKTSAGRLLALAANRGLVRSEDAAELRRAVSIANAAIHGSELPDDVAIEAAQVMNQFVAGIATAAESATGSSPHARREAYVRPTPGGGWEVLGPNTKTGEKFESQRQAVDAARDLLWRQGGGEVRIYGSNGRIKASDTVAAKPPK